MCVHIFDSFEVIRLTNFYHILDSKSFNLKFSHYQRCWASFYAQNGLLTVCISFFVYYLLPLSFGREGYSFCYWFVEIFLYWITNFTYGASLVAQWQKNLPAMQETWVRFLGWKDPLEKEMQPTPVYLPGEFHGWGGWQATAQGVPKHRT